MNTRNVVKVMNFHSLLRVDKAKKRASRYLQMEEELRKVIEVITNNRNLLLDKAIFNIKADAPTLTIYFGSDFGFCSNYNSQSNEQIKKDEGNKKIIIGKKLFRERDDVISYVTRDDFNNNFAEIEKTIYDGIKNNRFSSINVAYNQYFNTSDIRWTIKTVFPMELDKNSENIEGNLDDFYCESDINELMLSLISAYIEYELKIVAMNSFASENIMRQNATYESIKKIDEREEEQYKVIRKEENKKSFQKIIDNFSKTRYK